MSVRIITDSACDMSCADHPALTVLPLSVAFGERVYLDGVDLSHERFYEMLVEEDELPTTGQITPYAYVRAIKDAEVAGEEVLIIALSDRLSGTYHSAVTAAAQAASHPRVVDTQSVTVGERVLVEYALRLADQGLCADQIADAVEAARDRVVVVGLLDTLEYLRRGGRVPAAVGVVGDLLSIKPVVTVEGGEVVLLGRARGSKNGRNLLTREIERAGGVDFSMPLVLGYSGLSDALLQKYVKDSRALWEGHVGELPVHTVGATIGTHVGPGAIAVAFFRP